MRQPAAGPDDETMTEGALSKLRDTANHERYGLRRAEERMAAEAAELERMLDVFKLDLSNSEKRLEAGFRVQHAGRDPVRPLSWVAI
jgi:hypothetical protein